MKDVNMQLQTRLNKLLKRKQLTGKDVAYFYLLTYSDKLLGKSTFKLEDFREIERRLNDYELSQYEFYNKVYFSFIPLLNKALDLRDTFTATLKGFSNTLETHDSIETLQQHKRLYPCLLDHVEYSMMFKAARDNIRDNIDETIAKTLVYFLDPSLEPYRWHVSEIEKQLLALNVSTTAPSSYPFLSVPLYRLSNGSTIQDFEAPSYLELLEDKALQFTGSIDIKSYVNVFVSEKKLELFYKGPKAIREHIKATTKERPRYTDEEIESLMEKSVYSHKITDFRNSSLREFENCLGFFPKLEEAGETTNINERHVLSTLLALYMKDESKPLEEKLNNMKLYFNGLYSSVNNYLEEQLKSRLRSMPDYLVYILSNRQLEPVREQRLKYGGIAISRSYVNPYTEATFNYGYPTLKTESTKEDLSLYTGVAFINCYNILVDIIARVFDYKDLPLFAKIDFDFYEYIAKEFNSSLYHQYYWLSLSYEGKQLKQQRQQLKEAFPFRYLRDVKDFYPSKSSIETVEEHLKELLKEEDPRGEFRILENITISVMLPSIYDRILM